MSRPGGVLIVGLGGLGTPAAQILAASGVARLGLVDSDSVELSNLPRQPLYGEADLGRVKVETARERLIGAYPGLEVEAQAIRLDAGFIKGAGRAFWPRLIERYDVVIDGTDNLESKLLLNQGALDYGIPLVHAGVLGHDGQLFTILPERTACLRCLFPELPPDDELPSCQEAGVLGPVVGAIGLAAAREALAVLQGRTPPLAGRLAILDGARLRWRQVELRPNRRCPSCHASGAQATGTQACVSDE